MEVVFSAEIIAWLTDGWDGNLDWDGGNLVKLAKHGVDREEIESLFDYRFVVGGRILPMPGFGWSEDRFILYGENSNKRKLTIVWTTRGQKIRPISCRRMRKNEEKIFEEIWG